MRILFMIKTRLNKWKFIAWFDYNSSQWNNWIINSERHCRHCQLSMNQQVTQKHVFAQYLFLDFSIYVFSKYVSGNNGMIGAFHWRQRDFHHADIFAAIKMQWKWKKFN